MKNISSNKVKKLINDIMSNEIYEPLELLSRIEDLDIELSLNECIELLEENVKLCSLISTIKEMGTFDESEMIEKEIIKNLMLAFSILSGEEDFNNPYSNSSLDILKKELAAYPVLSEKKEYELAIKVREGDRKARHELINHNIRLVISIAAKYVNNGLSFEDLVEEGTIGLIKAVGKYNPKKGKFSTYAAIWIKQSIVRAIGNQKSQIRVPINQYEKLTKLYQKKEELKKINGEEPSNDELAEYLGTNLEKIENLLAVIPNIKSLDDKINEEGRDLKEVIPSSVNIEKELDNKELYFQLYEVLRSGILSDIEYRIICLRFGLITGEANYLENIGLLLGMSRESVRKIEKTSLEKLREFIVNNNLFKTGIEYMPDGYMLYKGDTIYQDFLLYTKAEIDFAINNLSNNEQRMLHLKFGIDFNIPYQDPSWTDECELHYQEYIYPKIINLLEENYYNKYLKKEAISSELMKKIITCNEFFTNQEKSKLRKIYADDLFQKILNEYAEIYKEIIKYRLGIDVIKCFSFKTIRVKFEKSFDEIDEIVKNVSDIFEKYNLLFNREQKKRKVKRINFKEV